MNYINRNSRPFELVAKTITTLLATVLLAACDPAFSLKRTLSVEGTVTHDCIVSAAKALKNDISIKRLDNPDQRRAFDEYTLGNDQTRLEVLWYHSNPNKVEIGTSGIGHADAARDAPICALMRSFEDSMIEACKLDRKKVSVKEKYVRASCK